MPYILHHFCLEIGQFRTTYRAEKQPTRTTCRAENRTVAIYVVEKWAVFRPGGLFLAVGGLFLNQYVVREKRWNSAILERGWAGVLFFTLKKIFIEINKKQPFQKSFKTKQPTAHFCY